MAPFLWAAELDLAAAATSVAGLFVCKWLVTCPAAMDRSTPVRHLTGMCPVWLDRIRAEARHLFIRQPSNHMLLAQAESGQDALTTVCRPWRRRPVATAISALGHRAIRTDLDHLPAAKRRELERVVEILFEEFGDAHGTATGKRKAGRILKIILFGSYARGGWVDEPHTAKGYQSDYDLLVIVNQDELTDRATYWHRAEERLIRETTITHWLRTPVNFIVHTLQEVNDALAHGRFFFIDIARDGIALYQADDKPLHTPRQKTPSQALDLAREYFEEWFPSAVQFSETAKFAADRGWSKKAAFDLHQATERLYYCVLLVGTFYTPHVHNIAFLRAQADKLDPRLVDVWPRNTREARARFVKLKNAYVKARYSKHYRISAEELAWLGARVEELGRAVQDVCLARIDVLRREAGG